MVPSLVKMLLIVAVLSTFMEFYGALHILGPWELLQIVLLKTFLSSLNYEKSSTLALIY